MQISVKKLGGFAGLEEIIAEIDTTQLPATKRQVKEEMVQNIDFFNLPPVIAGEMIGADMFHYEVTIIDGSRKHTITFGEHESIETAPLHKLIDTLRSL